MSADKCMSYYEIPHNGPTHMRLKVKWHGLFDWGKQIGEISYLSERTRLV